jgi:predicted Zn-dependent peptidase
MTQWQPPKREPPKTKAELRDMLAEALRNSQAENERLRRAKKAKAA